MYLLNFLVHRVFGAVVINVTLETIGNTRKIGYWTCLFFHEAQSKSVRGVVVNKFTIVTKI